MLVYLGINLEPNFSRRSTHLLCPSGTGAKFDKAREWGIPVINMAWLAEMATSGTVPLVSDYLVSVLDEGCPTFAMDVLEEVLGQDTAVDPNGKGKTVDKGKGKAKETDIDFKMHDITNSKWGFDRVGTFQTTHRRRRRRQSTKRCQYCTTNSRNTFRTTAYRSAGYSVRSTYWSLI